jgi:general secretion pathway protein G
MRFMSSRQKGFTLTEMMVVAAILAIIAGAALPLTKIAVKREKEFELRRNLRTIRDAIDAYKRLADEKKIETEDGTDGYPPSLEILVKGVKAKPDEKSGKKAEERLIKFLRRIPKDPMTNSLDWSLRSTQDSPDSNTWGEQNVFDVSTKTRGTALDGTKYRDW